MALLDVSEVIGDPMFTTPIEVVKSLESYDDKGNPQWLDGAVASVEAVVTADTKTIERLPEALRREGTIIVRVLVDDLPPEFEGGGYDYIIWRGKRFVVKDTADYSQFGSGFLRMTCVPGEVTDGNYGQSPSGDSDPYSGFGC